MCSPIANGSTYFLQHVRLASVASYSELELDQKCKLSSKESPTKQKRFCSVISYGNNVTRLVLASVEVRKTCIDNELDVAELQCVYSLAFGVVHIAT
jgi:hypothetical protein